MVNVTSDKKDRIPENQKGTQGFERSFNVSDNENILISSIKGENKVFMIALVSDDKIGVELKTLIDADSFNSFKKLHLHYRRNCEINKIYKNLSIYKEMQETKPDFFLRGGVNGAMGSIEMYFVFSIMGVNSTLATIGSIFTFAFGSGVGLVENHNAQKKLDCLLPYKFNDDLFVQVKNYLEGEKLNLKTLNKLYNSEYKDVFSLLISMRNVDARKARYLNHYYDVIQPRE